MSAINNYRYLLTIKYTTNYDFVKNEKTLDIYFYFIVKKIYTKYYIYELEWLCLKFKRTFLY